MRYQESNDVAPSWPVRSVIKDIVIAAVNAIHLIRLFTS